MAAGHSVFLPSNEVFAGYIFICSNRTMKFCLREKIFGMTEPFRNSVEAITPGIPIFLYNCTTRRLRGGFEAADSGGYNIEPRLWPDARIPGRSFYPAQARVRRNMKYQPLSVDTTTAAMQDLMLPDGRFRIELRVREVRRLTTAFREN